MMQKGTAGKSPAPFVSFRGETMITQTVANSTAVERALSLYDLLLFTAKKYSAADFISLLECSKSTVSRLLQQIDKRQGMALNRDTYDGREWYSLEAPARRPRIIVSPEEFQKLAACLEKSAIPAEEAEEMRNILRRLSLLCCDDGSAITSAINPVSKSCVDLTDSASVMAVLCYATTKKIICNVRWQTKKGQTRTWKMAPVKIFASADSVYAAGWHIPDTVKDDIVTQDILEKAGKAEPVCLYVHHLAHAEVTAQTYALPMPLPVTQHFGFAGGEPFRLHVLFSPYVADFVQERHFSNDEAMVSHADGSLELSCTATSRSEVLSWLLGFGAGAKLLEPSDLIPRLAQELAAIYKQYHA